MNSTKESRRSWREMKLSASQFEHAVSYCGRMSQSNIEAARLILVNGESPSIVSKKTGKSLNSLRQSYTNIYDAFENKVGDTHEFKVNVPPEFHAIVDEQKLLRVVKEEVLRQLDEFRKSLKFK